MFKSKTVDSVLSSFHKNLTDLAEVQKDQEDRAEALKAQADELTKQSEIASREAERAQSVAAKITALLS